jgi:hypothetical protein
MKRLEHSIKWVYLDPADLSTLTARSDEHHGLHVVPRQIKRSEV